MDTDYRALMALFICLPADEKRPVVDEMLHQADGLLVDGKPAVDYRIRPSPTGYSIEISTSGPFVDDDE